MMTIVIEEFVDIEKCGRAHIGRVALAEEIGLPNNSQLTSWIQDNREQYEAWCAEHYYELFQPTFREHRALEKAVESHFDEADQLVRSSLTDAELVWCLNDSSSSLVADAAATLGIGPSVLADEIRIELTGAQARVLTVEEARPVVRGAWDAWYALRPDYFIRSCEAAFAAFGGSTNPP
jgi:hypothetical protein